MSKEIQKADKKVIKLPISTENSELAIGRVEYEEKELVSDNKQFAMGVVYLIESSGASYDQIAIWNFKEACKRHNVTCGEMIDAYWKAYADPYVGKEGIQFRHLYKHIEKSRTGGQKVLTYNQMLADMNKRGITMDSYKQVEELDDNGNKKWVLK